MDPGSPGCVLVYTELVLKTAAYILYKLYDTCRIWLLSRKMIQGIRRFDQKTLLGNAANASEYLSLVDVIEDSRFWDLLNTWSCSVLLSPHPGCSNGAADYRFNNPFSSCFTSKDDERVGFRGIDRRVPFRHGTGFDFSDVGKHFIEDSAYHVRLQAGVEC